jgi:hypothetical protein
VKHSDPFPRCHTSFSDYKFNEFVLKNNESDSCCRVDKDIFIEIVEFANDKNGEKMVLGRKYTKWSSFFVDPDDSLDLEIAYCENLNPVPELFSIKRITAKLFRMPYKHGFVVVPILHWGVA